MRIPSFRVSDRRSIRLASCEKTNQIMIITGPNGCGKSTLLDAIREEADGSEHVLYVGPHRSSGRQQVRLRYLSGDRLSMRKVHAERTLRNYEGISIHNSSRDAWDLDETGSYLKYAMCQIELDRQSAVTERYDREGEILSGSVPDVWQPLRDMCSSLLPHIAFHQIDITNREHVRCLWNVHATGAKVDIDDLSSGEKAIVQLFFPLIEHQIQALIQQSKGNELEKDGCNPSESLCVLMDEPELHLHPNLQRNILNYLRSITSRESSQFILATHSQMIIESASSDELFLLRPSELTPKHANQLIQIASTNEKLEMMRDIFGSTSNITAMRPILVVEGRKADESSKSPEDSKIFELLSNEFARFSLVSGGSKNQCKVLAQSLTELFLKELGAPIQALALVDRDSDPDNSEDATVHQLPVSMIENFLVDPDVIWEAIMVVRHKTKFNNTSEVESALDTILDQMESYEVSRRVMAGVGYVGFRLHAPIDDAESQVSEHIEKIKSLASVGAINELKAKAEANVRQVMDSDRRREEFDGKEILHNFYKQFLHKTGMSFEIFVYQCAESASSRSSVASFVQELMNRV